MKNTFSRKFTVCALAGVLGFALSACDDSSSAGGDDNGETSALSSSAKVTEPAEVTDGSSDSREASNDAQSSGNEKSSSSVTPKSAKSSSSSGDPKSSSSSDMAETATSSSDGSIYDASANILTDLRDGRNYKTTTIAPVGTNYSEVWMAENLNYRTENSFCYRDKFENCDKYGRLYLWSAAVGKTLEECGYGHKCDLGAGFVRGVCPKGWHLPSKSEWENLIVAVDDSITEYTSDNKAGRMLKSTTDWTFDGNGVDSYSFSALPAGKRDISTYFYNGYYGEESEYAHFWSSTVRNDNWAYQMSLFYYRHDNATLNDSSKDMGYSVRCVKDSE
ncbi:major paralogous domain-containing protein [Fibrobacter sp. UWB15]|uniref:fibrobacter succinogenes major paralogous domain-containing protein n=1 Tax=unclassified Fibrobacter TaxID=2634177 RepID=UPI00091A0EAB|nr:MULTISPECIES: fibrobacter succinogenes major paralogous domain-containing protein [unclassified Fibrobacter]PWJ67937.1 uncharacterized protein (TIGR02145 family) [Fibrobacter sp. UWB6]SHF82440.1 major paralogous domain-containing protein [Fibrobacter sp. UWB8]SMG16481.1 major paralogous domain-containing protein [Fibrobacter sp. UWB15]